MMVAPQTMPGVKMIFRRYRRFDMRFQYDLAWRNSIWARLAGWPVVMLLSWQVWRMLLLGGIHGGMPLSALSTAMEAALFPFALSALFLIMACGYGTIHGMGGPDWTGPIAAYLLFPFIAVMLILWTNQHGWSVPIIAFSPILVLEGFFTLMDSIIHAIENHQARSRPRF